MAKAPDPDTVWVRSEEAISTPISDRELALMSIEQGKYYGLNEVSSRIWELLEQPASVREICERLQAEYAVDEVTCREQVQEFMAALKKRDLVRQV